jgi:amino acid adenylation domain-containing protein
MPAALLVLPLDVDRSWQSLPATNPDPAALGLSPSHLAYVIYTSGSTGTPKGVMVAHAGLCNLAYAQMDGFEATPASRVLQFASFRFDACIFEVLMALCSGAALHVPSHGVLAGSTLRDVLRDGRITHATLPPAVLAALPDDTLPELQTLVMAGEAASHALVQRWAPGRQLINAYGPTETTVWASMQRCDAQHAGPPPIGSPIANTRIYILDANGKPSPFGVTGEICIAGIQVARGYLRRPDLTAERFVPDPFAEPGSRMYKTGDLGRWRPDGSIEFLGRSDHQVKVRGFRIELGEIEAALRLHPEVHEAVVLAREDVPGDPRLVAYVIGEAAPEALRAHLGSRLAEYMVPAAYVVLDALPLTPNGKLDRKALPAPEADAYGTRAYEAPQGEIEALLAQVWSALLGPAHIGRHDSFFALGGHSLLAVQLTSRIRTALGLEVPLAELFAQPTLAGYAERVAATTASALPAIVPTPREGGLPLSFAQQRLWFLGQLDERTGAAYAMPGGVRLKGALDVAALQAALNRIVARHEALRTCFGLVDGEPVQIIAPPEVGLALSQADVSVHAHPEAELERLAGETFSAPFDLARGPLIRGCLVRMADADHALLITMHHIVSDGWSMGVLINEFSALYAAYSQGRPDPLPPLVVQYADYAVWQRRWITGAVLQRQLDFWRGHLSGAPALLELPTDRPRPAVQDYSGTGIDFELGAELTADLRALSQRHGTTLSMTLLASWAALLARLSGEHDVVIGTPVANRHRAEIEPLIGFFVNTQALRVDLSGSPSVGELLAQVRATALAAQAHQDVPFEQVVEALSPARSLAHSPVFQVMFAWQNAPEGSLDLPGLQLEPVKASSTTVKFDLELSLHDAGDRIAGSLGYACTLFDGASIERHLSHWQTLLRAFADEAERVDRLPLLTASERQRLLHVFNDTTAPFPHEHCIHQLFEQQAVRTPNATALVFEATSLTYRELNARANRVAQHLIALGVQAGDCVALALPRCDDLVAAELAMLKCGAAYVPLDLDHPSERLHFMLADCAARVLVCRSHCSLLGLTPLELDLLADPGICIDPQRPVHPQASAYVMYTSGSTGTPKGVVAPHRAVVNLALQQRLSLRADDRFAFASNPAFDSATLEVWGALLHGAAIVVVPQAVLLDPVALVDHLQRYHITQLILVAGVLRSYAPTLQGQLSTLRQIITGGDMADAHAIATVLGAGGAGQVLQTYGPTETTQFVSTLALRKAPTGSSPIPIGSPIANARIYILDAHGQPTPLGVTGEIHIGGVGVAQGYLRRPDLTAQRFVPDPFGEPGSRMYKTGDLGRWRADGTIEFLGRNDHQVKIRGFRIELGEIEAALRSHPEVSEAVVLARDGAPGDKRLVAYVVGEVAPEALRTHLGARLPEYMVPAAYVRLDALPLTPNGKLDRRALPAPETDAFGTRVYEAPQGEIETLLTRLWSELLGINGISRHDDFFILGGHSLLAVQLSSRIRTALGVEVPLAELFAQPTLAGYARRVAAATASALPAIVPAPRQEALPLSFAQQRLWFLAQLDERAGAAYAIPGGVRLKGALDVAALQAALNRIVSRHEALRTCFGSVDGAPVQLIASPEVGLALWQVDLPSHADREAELQRMAAEEASAPFDLAQGPLIRARLVRMGHDDHALLVTMHHIVSDGWSMSVLVHEFSALYAAISQGQPDPLPALPIQYADYAMWQRRWITGEVLQRQLDFWRHHLSGAAALLELPTDRPRPAVQDYAGAFLGFELDADLTAKLKALSQRHGTTLFMTLFAAWAVLLARLSGQSDVVIGTPVANRHRAEIEPLIGFFVNTQALRVDLSGSPSVAELLAQVRATALAAQDHQDLPFEQVVEALSPQRSLAHSPVFQVMFAWQNAPEGRLDLPGLQLQPVGAQATTIKFDLELSLQDAGACFTGHIGYACALFDRATVERHIAHWQTLLRGWVADEQALVARLPLLSHHEQHQLLHGFNDTAVALPAEHCIHTLFEAQVERMPEATALEFEDTALSYAELNAQANRLAHHLIALGVQPDTRVAIALPRGIDGVVALLATLKAGGVYVPLDTQYPAQRLAFMLADSAPRLLITSSTVSATLGALQPSVAVLTLDGESRPWVALPATNPDPRVLGLCPDHVAYVIYTSGSTGTPKGVEVCHAGLLNYGLAAIAAYGVGPADRVLQCRSVGFDVVMDEVFTTLCAGATLVLLPWPQLPSIAEFMGLVERKRLTLLNLPTAYWHEWVAALNASGEAVAASVRLVVSGGEQPSMERYRQWRQCVGDRVTWLNSYGPTEATVAVTFARIAATDEVLHIGGPSANTRLYLLDAHGAPVPLGVAGELYIGGAQVARGYLHRPELTAERFVPDPFVSCGARMYKTGDLGRWRPDGSIEFLGRADAQVKIRGFRIEPGEIETALRSHPDVREAIVLAREDVPGDQRLVAYVVGAVAPEALRQHLGSRLPPYMLPAAYVALDALPITPNGKLDRAALPAPHESAGRTNHYEPPRTGIEQVLAKVWSRVLNMTHVGRDDHFFELGGHSMLAVRLVAEAKQRGLGLTLQDVYAHPTLRAQAERVLGVEPSPGAVALAVRRMGTEPTLFALPTGAEDLTYAFELAAHLESDAPIYAIPWPEVIPDSMDALAAHTVGVMRTVQPVGPYRLLGYSSGALLAYAIAQSLAEQNERVEFVGMLDCEHRPRIPVAQTPEELAKHQVLLAITDLMDQATSGEQDDVQRLLRQLTDDVPRTPWDELIARYENHALLSTLAAANRRPSIRHIATTFLRTAQFAKLWPSYAARALPAPLKLHVFYATEGTAPPHPLGWQQLLPLDEIIILPVPGTHTSLMEPPHIEHVSRAVSQALRHARSASVQWPSSLRNDCTEVAPKI